MQTKLEAGLEYERYVKNIIKDKYKNLWLWSELPKEVLLEIGCIQNIYESCDDIGCDIVCQLFDNSFIFIQCKNYSTTGIDNTINISDLAGFYNFIAETGYIGIVYYSGKLSSQIIVRKKKITYINLPHIKNNKILDFKPREYQIEAYNKLKNNNRAVLSMPCGTGKTFVSFLLSLDYKNVVILTPLISTTEQILSHYKNYYNQYTNISYVLVNCQAKRKIDTNNNKMIIASTYASCNIILNILDKLENTLVIIDEYHNISNTMITEDNSMNRLLKTKHDVIFMSATPKEHEIFGNCRYELSWNDAISNKYICDYNFYYPDNSKIITKIDELKFDKTLIEKTILINKAYYLLESIKEYNIKKCIVYLKTIKEAEEFVKVLITLNIYFEHNIKVYNINCNTTKGVRNKYLDKFKCDNSCINVLCNVHILDEGIDIPECDSVYLTHPNNNPTSIIQRISRANRLDSNNKDKIAKILLWAKDKLKLENVINNISKIIKINFTYNSLSNVNNIDNIDNIDNIIKEHENIIISIFYKTFAITNKSLFIIDINYNIWFGLRDIIHLLGYTSYDKTIATIKLSKEYKISYSEILSIKKYYNMKPHKKFINKSGLFELLSLSNKSLAKKFITNLLNIL